MVRIIDIAYKQSLHVIESDRYSIRNAQIHDDVAGRFVTVDEIAEDMVNMR